MGDGEKRSGPGISAAIAAWAIPAAAIPAMSPPIDPFIVAHSALSEHEDEPLTLTKSCDRLYNGGPTRAARPANKMQLRRNGRQGVRAGPPRPPKFACFVAR